MQQKMEKNVLIWKLGTVVPLVAMVTCSMNTVVSDNLKVRKVLMFYAEYGAKKKSQWNDFRSFILKLET